jgi:hypothetical protein
MDFAIETVTDEEGLLSGKDPQREVDLYEG